MNKKRRVGIIIGSESDLPQCLPGLDLLKKLQEQGLAKVLWVKVRSIHRNTIELLCLLDELNDLPAEEQPSVLIVGAGWANHLTGTTDAYLRHCLKNDLIHVVGVAFADEKEPRHTKAAELSISEVPGTQVIFRDSQGEQFVGAEGFEKACLVAARGDLPPIVLKPGKPAKDFYLVEAIETAKPKEA